MTERQKKFVNEYIKSGNATQSAIAAGYSEKGAGQTAGNLLKNTEIKKSIDKAKAEAAERAKITIDEHLDVLKRLRDDAWKEGVFGAAIKAEEDRGKVCGLYEERVRAELSGPSGGAMEVRHVVELVRSEDGREA